MATPAIDVVGLSKRYRLGTGAAPYGRLTESLARALRSAGRRANGHDRQRDHIWALKDVSLQVQPGEVVGIIGRNGAGKTTLLKILSRITEPTEGHAYIAGRAGSLLEVGTGFHPDLTGRENVYLNGAILGMRRREIRSKFDEIVEFAEVSRFLDTPVKHYSSGMRVRLAFAVAAHLEPEILIIDEVLAVGDAAFQRKCLGKMSDIAEGGRTVLFVSHNMGIISSLCSRAVLLDHGVVLTSGDPEEVIKAHLEDVVSQPKARILAPPPIDKGVVLERADVLNSELDSRSELDYRSPFFIKTTYRVRRVMPDLSIWLRLVNHGGVYIFLSWAAYQEQFDPGLYESIVEIPGELLAPGRYYLDIGAEKTRVEAYHYAHKCLAFDVLNTDPTFDPRGRGIGVIHPQFEWVTSRLESSDPRPVPDPAGPPLAGAQG